MKSSISMTLTATDKLERDPLFKSIGIERCRMAHRAGGGARRFISRQR
jgi:hypothetical protein